MRLSCTCFHLIQLADLLQYKVQLVDNEIDGPLLDEWVDTADDRSFTLLGDAFRWDPGGGRGALAERDLSDRQTCSTDQREESQGRGLQLQLPSWKSKVKDPNYMINQHFWSTSISDLTFSNSRNNIKLCQLLSLCGQSLNPFSSRWRFQNSRIAKTCQYFGRFDHDHSPSFCKKILKILPQYVKSTSVPKSWYGGRGGGLSQFWQCQISKTPIQTTLPLQ